MILVTCSPVPAGGIMRWVCVFAKGAWRADCDPLDFEGICISDEVAIYNVEMAICNVEMEYLL